MSLADANSAKSTYFIVMAIIAAIAGILFGYDTGVVSGAILFIRDSFHLSPQANGLVVSAVLFGALLGALGSGRLADRFGRKRLLLADSLIFIAGTLLTAVGATIPIIIIGRIIVGIAIGVASYVAPLYISEVSPTRYRGALVSLNQLAITVGILLSYLVDYYFAPLGEWRWMFAVGALPAVIFLLGLLYLPDSPRWFVASGKPAAALQVLQRIYADHALATREFNAIRASVCREKSHQAGSWRLLFSATIRPTLMVGIGLAILQQVTGINTIIYYAPTIFGMAGFQSATTAILATMGVGVVFFLFTIFALPLIDTLGRRPLLLAGLAGMALSLFTLSYVFLPGVHTAGMKWAALAAMLVFIACFAFSLGPIMWLMISEIYPLRVRGLGSSLATASNWGSNMVVALTFLTLVQVCGVSITFALYGAIGMLGMLFIYYYVPETKGVSLEQIEAHLETGLAFSQLGRQQLSHQAALTQEL